MAVTQIQICNSALTKIGADRISSITQDTKSAVILNSIYDQIRDAVLRAHPWNFAIKRAALAPTSTTPAFEYTYAYDLPSDCLRILDLDSLDIDFVVENGQILSDESTLNVRYIYRNEDESLWDSCFAEAMSWRLARELAFALRQSAPLIDACDKGYEKALREARTMDGAEGIIRDAEIVTWTDSRR